jgi:hypothetical protein
VVCFVIIVGMMIGRGDLQFYVGSKLGGDILLISRVLSLVEVRGLKL